MSLIVPDTQELIVINGILNRAMTMRLYSNDYTPTGSSTVAAFTECAGGGYIAKPLSFANWNIVSGDPTQASYRTTQTWTFTGALSGPGTAYGYYVTQDSDGALLWAERFPTGSLPFSPIAGSQVRVLPRYSVQSQF